MSKNVKTNKKQEVDSRFSTLKTFSVASIVIFVSIAIILNVFLYLVFDNALTIDLSATKQNTASQVLVDYINSLPGDSKIRIVALFDKPINLAGTGYEYMIPLLDDLDSKTGDRLSVEYINQEVNPTITKELDPNGLFSFANAAYSFYVCYEGNIKELNPYNCFDIDYSSSSSSSYTFKANNVNATLSSVIYNLTNPDHSKAYFLSGLDTTGMGVDSHSYLDQLLNSLCIDTADLPISDTFAIPEDCDLLFISGITTDITEHAAVVLKDYINNGGKLIVAVDYYYGGGTSFTNLNDVLHEVNLHIDSYLIKETDTTLMLDGVGYQDYVSIQSAYSGLTTTSSLRASYMRPIREYDNPNSYISVDSVLTTSENAYVCGIGSDGQLQEMSPESKAYYPGMHATFTDVSVPPEVYVFGTTDLTTDMYYVVYGINDGNATFIKNLVSSMIQTESGLDVPSLPVADYTIDASKATTKNTAFYTFLFIVIIPMGFVIAAAFVYNKRKNL